MIASIVASRASRCSGRWTFQAGTRARRSAMPAKQRARLAESGVRNVSDHRSLSASADCVRSTVTRGESVLRRTTARSGTGRQSPRRARSTDRLARSSPRATSTTSRSRSPSSTSARTRSIAGPGITTGTGAMRRQLMSSESRRKPSRWKPAASVVLPKRPGAANRTAGRVLGSTRSGGDPRVRRYLRRVQRRSARLRPPPEGIETARRSAPRTRSRPRQAPRRLDGRPGCSRFPEIQKGVDSRKILGPHEVNYPEILPFQTLSQEIILDPREAMPWPDEPVPECRIVDPGERLLVEDRFVGPVEDRIRNFPAQQAPDQRFRPIVGELHLGGKTEEELPEIDGGQG